MARLVAAESAPGPHPGLQPERTSLAWGRTVLGFVVVATVVLKAAPANGPVVVLSALAYQVVAVVVGLRNAARYRRAVRQMTGRRIQPPVLEVLALSTVTAALGLHWLWLSAPPGGP